MSFNIFDDFDGGLYLEKLGKMQHKSKWVDVERKARRIISTNGVALQHKRPYDVYKPDSIVEIKARVRGDHGTYESTIHQPHPKSRAIRWWDCQCTWRRYVWDRRPIWITDKNGIRREVNKKFEGRVCSHVLALWWYSASVPVSLDEVPEEVLRKNINNLIEQDRLFPSDYEKLQSIIEEGEDMRLRQNKPDASGSILEAEREIENLETERADLEEQILNLDPEDDHYESKKKSRQLRIYEIDEQIANQQERIKKIKDAESINKSIQGELTNKDIDLVVDNIFSGQIFNIEGLGLKADFSINDITQEEFDKYNNRITERNKELEKELAIAPSLESKKEIKERIQKNQRSLQIFKGLLDFETPELSQYRAELIELNRKLQRAKVKGFSGDWFTGTESEQEIREQIKNRQELIQAIYRGQSTFDFARTQIDRMRDEVERQPNIKAVEKMPGIPENEPVNPEIASFGKNAFEEAFNFFRSNGMVEQSVDLRRAIENEDQEAIKTLMAEYGNKKAEGLGWSSLFDQETPKTSSVSFLSSDVPINDIVFYIQQEIADDNNPYAFTRREMWGEQRGGFHPHPDAQPISVRPDGNFVYSPDDLGYHPERGEMGHNLEERGTYGSIPVGGKVKILLVEPKDRLVMIEHGLENDSPNHQHIRIWIPLKDIDLI